MTGRRAVLVLAVIACVGVPPLASAPVDRAGYYKIMDRFFELVSEGKPGEAVDAIYDTSPYRDKIADQIASLKSQFSAASAATFGEYRAREVLIDKEIVGRYAYVYVFVAYDRQPMKMEFHFYRPKDKWVLQKFSYSPDVDDDIATFAQYDLMK